ncbi:MAG: hypothetical protein VX590_02150 [Chloroflexota bacterium]|jgi:hypothetical protein|nr:hypothetical protein [Chloroflexota bacterium]
MSEQFPSCNKCDNPDAVLVPLSDFGGGGAPIHYKAWVCTNEECGFNLKIRNGDVLVNEVISDGSQRERRDR